MLGTDRKAARLRLVGTDQNARWQTRLDPGERTLREYGRVRFTWLALLKLPPRARDPMARIVFLLLSFLLYRADYDRIWPLLTNALWPYSAPHPDRADDEYLSALKALAVGQLTLTVRTYDADPANGSIRQIKFQAEFTAPENFELNPA